MSKKTDKPPSRGSRLFKNLFGECPPDASLKLVTMGISASLCNVARLLSDVKLLTELGRLSSARFLLTTAREELAKSYILIDTCRLDLEKHDSALKQLCNAFYDHIFKHAYMKVHECPNINSMSDAKNIWGIEVKLWWPSGPESGEPDMPHNTSFDREFPLYIDYGNYEHQWLIPTDSDQNAYFIAMLGETPVSKTEKLLELWKPYVSSVDILPKVISILNAVFKKHYIGEGATWEQLLDLYNQVAERVMPETGISPELFMTSPFVRWPLYHFTSECKKG